ncbi:MAG: TlpA disulfide reductase family protein [Pseudomonadota bacterium]|nr:TlpA disulfide reductase family protein [Pseudomonadota bacterium]MEE3221532.1 TlpA disulfide reductase family protein [Pseudomonadota bacterium]
MLLSQLKSNAGKIKPILFLVLLALVAFAGAYTYQRLQHDFETLDGTAYLWQDLEGKWVVVNYFAPWCAPCLREMPELVTFNHSLPDDTRLFAINYDLKTKPELKAMAKKFDIELPVIVSSPDTKLPMQKPPYLPATFILGPDGKIKDTIMGEITAAHLRQRLAELKGADE